MVTNSSLCQCKPLLVRLAAQAGIAAFGVCRAEAVDPAAIQAYDQWIAHGANASMHYAARYGDVRSDPRKLLEDARSIIVCAFSYCHPYDAPTGHLIASYAHGDDYHDVVRQRLTSIAEALTAQYGGACRVTVDTAPLLERYHAVKAGIGFIGRNHQLIVNGCGSRCFIGSIITTLDIAPDTPNGGQCLGCGRCLVACPGGALRPDGTFDARRCLSYLTIEHRGDLPEGTDLHGHLYGCDVCQDVCPHNADCPASPIEQFALRPGLCRLTPQAVAQMSQADFSATFARSAIKRARLAGLQRNAAAILNQTSNSFFENNAANLRPPILPEPTKV